jgi:hypothetical protein
MVIMPTFSPELIQTMRAALEEAMTKVPLDQATPGNKATFGRMYFESGCRRPDKLRGFDLRGGRPVTDNPLDVHLKPFPV